MSWMFPVDFQRKRVWSIAFSKIHTARSYFYRLLPCFEAVSRCEGLLPPSITGIYRPCECFKNQPFTPKMLKIKRKRALCEGCECFFGEINTYIRVRKGQIQNRWRHVQRDRTASLVRPDITWSPLHNPATCAHNSRTCPHKSLNWQNKSRTCPYNSRTCGKGITLPFHIRNFSHSSFVFYHMVRHIFSHSVNRLTMRDSCFVSELPPLGLLRNTHIAYFGLSDGVKPAKHISSTGPVPS